MAKPIRGVALVVVAALGLAACGSSSSGAGSSGGGGGKTVIISSDLPLQGAQKDDSAATNNLIDLYLSQKGYKAGDYTIKFEKYDDSTAAKGQWDDAQCQANATKHVATTDEVAVMGTFNSGCAQIELPILNQDPDGPMLMVSHANTNPGLTKAWDANEPQKYYPADSRNYARVIVTDDYQGSAAAKFAATKLSVKKVFVLNDNQTYGQGVAKAFVDAAGKNGIQVLGNEAWDGKQQSYAALFNKIKALGPDMVYLSGIIDSNGPQLIKDKVAVLGKNDGVKLMGPDGMTGSKVDTLPEAEGMYLTFGGQPIDQIMKAGGPAAKLLNDYQAKYQSLPGSSYALYAVGAVQVILAAIAKSDGTRKSVTEQVFSGSGIVIPANESATGAEIKIDPKTGDSIGGVMTVLHLTGGKENFLESSPVGS
jgi:branched-chain amino acid transport system substrate-binding protein